MPSASCTTIPSGSTTWTAAAAGDWFTSGNWDNGVPSNAATQTNITNGGTAQITGAAASAGPILNVCNGTVDLQSGSSLSAGSIAIAPHGTLLLSGSSAIALGEAIYLNGGTLRATSNLTVSPDLMVGTDTPYNGTISAAPGTTLTLTGALFFGSVARTTFGSTTDTGTILFEARPLGHLKLCCGTLTFEIVGGTLRAGSSELGYDMFTAGYTTQIDSGATLDFNDQYAVVNNLVGSGRLITGVNPATALYVHLGTFSGQITGAGELVKDTACDGIDFLNQTNPCPDVTLILSNTNTYSGGTVITQGILQLGNGGASGSILGNVTNNDTFEIDRSDIFAFNGVISGRGQFIQAGPGTTVLTAANTYTGSTNVNAGTLAVTGSIISSSGVAVNSGGTLSGTGSVGPTTVSSGGALAPGMGGVGTLTIDGAATFASGSRLSVAISPSSVSKLLITGTASLAGNLDVVVSAPPAPGTSYAVLTATGGISGTFALGTTGPFGNVVPTVSYDGYNVFVDFALISLTPLLPASATANEKAVTAGIDHAITHGDTLPTEFGDLVSLSPNTLANAATQLSGELGSDVPTLLASTVNPFLNVLLNQPADLDTDLGSRSNQSSYFASNAMFDGIADPLPAMSVTPMSDAASIWGSVYGGRTELTGQGLVVGSHSLSADALGIAGGLDVLVSSGFIVGAAIADSDTNFSLSNSLGTGHDNALQVGVYSTTRFARAGYFSIAGAYALEDVSTRRTVTVSGTDILEAKFQARTYAGRLEGGYRLHLAGLGITPYLALQYDNFNAPLYTETASLGSSAFALSNAAHKTASTTYEVGTGFDAAETFSHNTSLHFFGRIAWAHSGGLDQSANPTFPSLAASSYTVQGALPGANSLLVSLASELKGRNGLSFGLKLDGALTNNSDEYVGSGFVKYSW